jgi:FixJ family two-component response regulator
MLPDRTKRPKAGTDKKPMKPEHIPSSQALVIVVDDDLAVRNSLKFSLEIEGFRVQIYDGAGELLNAPAPRACACFVVDQNMPGMTGLDLIARLRERHGWTPAILITTHPQPALKERAERANIRIVEKPLLGNALVDCIRAACTSANGIRH